MDKIFIATNSQKILNFLAQNPGREYLSREIQKATGVSKAGTNLALNCLFKGKLIKREKRGKFYLYSAEFSSPVIKQFKVLRTVLMLSNLINKLKKCAHKIILYGSRSRGEDTADSDIDLFVVTNMPQEVERIVKKQAIGKRVRLVMRTPLKYIEMETADPAFYNEVERGMALWESR